MAYLNGRLGQVRGPFSNDDLLDENGAISNFTPESSKPKIEKLGIQTAPGTIVKINDVEIKIGKTGIYELDYVVTITSIVFPNGADESTLVDFIY